MALLQDIIGELTDLGFGQWQTGEGGQQSTLGYGDIANITPADIASNLQTYYGLESEMLPAHLFQGISQDILSQGLGKTYSPQIEAGGATLLSNLQQTLGGKQAIQAGGGFAGSGQQQRYLEGAKDVYGKGMTDVLAQTGQQRTAGLQSVQDVLNQWRETAAGIAY